MIRRDDVVTTARLAAGLPRFLRHPVTVSEARAVVGRRLERRLQDFLAQLRAIYGRPATPFARLLRHAGCEYADVEPLARRDGVEAALRTLLRHGVYLTVEELKARRPVTRHPAHRPGTCAARKAVQARQYVSPPTSITSL